MGVTSKRGLGGRRRIGKRSWMRLTMVGARLSITDPCQEGRPSLPPFRTITRKDLYDLVWSRPMRDVAVEFGILDVGLAKTCARHGIPSPPRGYWARLQAGQKVGRQSLAPG